MWGTGKTIHITRVPAAHNPSNSTQTNIVSAVWGSDAPAAWAAGTEDTAGDAAEKRMERLRSFEHSECSVE